MRVTWPLLAYLLSACLLCAQAAEQQLLAAGEAAAAAAAPTAAAAAVISLADQQQVARVVLVNAQPFHYEVLGGWVHVLDTLQWPLSVYFASPDYHLTKNGVFKWLGVESKRHEKKTCVCRYSQMGARWCTVHGHCAKDGALAQSLQQADLVICISPEYEVKTCKTASQTLKAKKLVTLVHRPGDPQGLTGLHPKQDIVALAPHVAAHKSQQLNMDVDWALPVAPFRPSSGVCMSRACLDGFVIQGSIRKHQDGGEGMTRNFGGIWSRMLEVKQRAKLGSLPINVVVLGKGNTSLLNIPAELSQNVQHYPHLDYIKYWGRIYSSLAIVPAFNMETYYTQRFSSTILASLVTSTPLIADQRLLDAYAFLKPEHVFLMEPGEDEVASMQRILNLPASEVIARRVALGKLRLRLNARTTAQLRAWAQEAGVAVAEP